MNIKRVRVENLFNTFSHEILFDDNVTIIMGENGVGKTVTLNLLDAIFNRRFDYLLEIEFSRIIVTFLKETWTFSRSVNREKNASNVELCITTSKKGAKPINVKSDTFLPAVPPFIEKIDEDTWLNNRTHTYIDKEQIYERYFVASGDNSITLPEWYQRQMERNKVKMIKTQRLISTNYNRKDVPSIYMVKNYSNELVKFMQDEINKAGLRGAEIDRTFPVRLIKFMKGHKNYEASDLYQNLNELDNYRHKLSDVGLLPEVEKNAAYDKLTSELDRLDNTVLSVMNLYIKDSRDKLKMYDSIYNKVSLLNEIINSRFNHKQLMIDSKRGFVFLSNGNNYDEIPVEKLSSGEQNELVLFFELLFKSDSKDLILIDEPEISLHLTWLQAMIGDLIRITKVNGASLLIATHSPDFVGDNYMYVQNLE